MKYIVLCIGISFLNAFAAEHGTLTIHNKTHQPVSISHDSPIDITIMVTTG